MTFNFRGCGTSEGDFSLQGWVDDLRAAIDHLIEETSPSGIWLVGTNTGGSHRHLRRRRRPAGPRCGAAQPACRLRRLGGPAAPVPRARPRDRRHPHAGLPAQLRRVGPRAAPLPAGRRRPPVRAAAAAGDARRRRRERAHGRRPPAGRGPRFGRAARSSTVPATACATTRGRWPCCSAGSTASGRCSPTEPCQPVSAVGVASAVPAPRRWR